MKKKYIITFVIVFGVSVIMEFCYFNFPFLLNQYEKLKPYSYTVNDCLLVNWENNNGSLTSSFDPAIIIENIDTKIKKLDITFNLDNGTIPYTEIFYTLNKNEVINSEHKILISENITDKLTVKLNKDIYALRIDLGDAENIKISNLNIKINDYPLDVNVSRIIAMNIIFWGLKLLFAMQRPPKYDI